MGGSQRTFLLRRGRRIFQPIFFGGLEEKVALSNVQRCAFDETVINRLRGPMMVIVLVAALGFRALTP